MCETVYNSVRERLNKSVAMAESLLLISLLCLMLMVLVIFNHYLPLFIAKRKGQVLPKGTFSWPLLGETLPFLKPHPSNTVSTFLQHHCYRYGKVFKSHLFLTPTIVSCDEELNYFILQNEEKLFQTNLPKTVSGIVGDLSMMVAVGDTHKRQRSVALSLIPPLKSNPQFLNELQTFAIRILDSWKHKDHVLFSEVAKQFTFNVIIKQVLGFSPDEDRTTRIFKDFLTFLKGFISLPINIPGTNYARAVKAGKRISSVIKAIILEIKEDSSGNSSANTDYLKKLLSVDTLSLDEKVSFVVDTLLAGYETTSTLLALVVHFLGHSPAALEKVKMEHINIRGLKKDDESLTFQDYNKMEFTQYVINESLRWGNIVNFLHRISLKDVHYKDYVIPSGWQVLPVISAVHLEAHENGSQFQPSRWEDKDPKTKRFTPFGGGIKQCPGSELGKTIVAFFLHHLVLNFRWRTKDGDQPIAYPYVEFEKGLPLSVEFCPFDQDPSAAVNKSKIH